MPRPLLSRGTGHAIVAEAEQLASEGRIRGYLQPTIHGTLAQWFSRQAGSVPPSLTPAIRAAADDVLRVYGRLPLPQLVAASKRTMPFSQVQQYELLNFESAVIEQAAVGDKDYQNHLDEIRRYGTVSLEELKQELGVG